MNLVEVTGGKKYQRDIAQKVVYAMIDTLMPRMRTLDIEVKIRKISGDAVGYCMQEDTNRMFTIDVQKDLSLRDFITTICHEMVHVKQYARNEMDCYGRKWKTKVISDKVGYYDLPWEKEAYRLQDKLAQEIWDADIL
tara:strand:- start:824 stop:1237 length:414 start_codon:yes stop_codon:yes gene_type:complete